MMFAYSVKTNILQTIVWQFFIKMYHLLCGEETNVKEEPYSLLKKKKKKFLQPKLRTVEEYNMEKEKGIEFISFHIC